MNQFGLNHILMADQVGVRQRQLLSLLLENKDGMSIDDLAKSLGISRNAVQQHVSVLELDGFLQAGELNKTAGRPVRSYVLTEAGINSFPKQYGWFSEAMLTELKAEMGAEAFERYMKKLGAKIAQGFLHRFSGKTADECRKELVSIMDELGFKTGKNAGNSANDKTITAYNCIFHDLVQNHREMCQFDLAFMQALLGQSVDLTDCMARGNGCCCFRIQPVPAKLQDDLS